MSPKPTISQLVRALRSEAVGLGRAAANLIEMPHITEGRTGLVCMTHMANINLNEVV